MIKYLLIQTVIRVRQNSFVCPYEGVVWKINETSLQQGLDDDMVCGYLCTDPCGVE